MFPDASDIQLGAHVSQIEATNIDYANIDEVLKQDYFPILLHSRKFSNYQINCTTKDKEILSTEDALVEHRSI